jgi:TonB family protein
MRLAMLLFCAVFAFGQSTSTPPEPKSGSVASPDQKPPTRDFGLGIGAKGQQSGALDILSDTQGVDFGPYLEGILQGVRQNWYHLIPASAEMKKGKLAIEFAITKDGKIADMRLVASSGDRDLDRPAWGSITASNPFPALPIEFTGPFLALRFRFYYNPDKSDLDPGRPKTSIGSIVSLTNSIICHGNGDDVVGCTNPPRQTHAPPPKYPKKERKAHHEGVVRLTLVVSSEGVPTEISVAQALSPDFDQAAIDAVKQWKFAPATKGGKPAAVKIAVEIAFHLAH